VQGKSSDKLHPIQGHSLFFAFLPVVFVAKGYRPFINGLNPVITDCYFVGWVEVRMPNNYASRRKPSTGDLIGGFCLLGGRYPHQFSGVLRSGRSLLKSF
jgi:hypothetical protein